MESTLIIGKTVIDDKTMTPCRMLEFKSWINVEALQDCQAYYAKEDEIINCYADQFREMLKKANDELGNERDNVNITIKRNTGLVQRFVKIDDTPKYDIEFEIKNIDDITSFTEVRNDNKTDSGAING